jgi:hypothetical protein
MPGKSPRIPLSLKLAYTAFVAVHATLNWQAYGPLNFLWFCDIALLTLLVALWTQSSPLASIAAVAILLPMALWAVDLAARIALGHYIFGFAGYMFDRRVPLQIRVLSSFHLWVPVVLLRTLQRLGYDRRALAVQSVFAAVLLIVCRFVSSPPPSHSLHECANINWVYGPADNAPQTYFPPMIYLGMMIVLYPLLIYLPTHMILSALFTARSPRPAEPRLTPVGCSTPQHGFR